MYKYWLMSYGSAYLDKEVLRGKLKPALFPVAVGLNEVPWLIFEVSRLRRVLLELPLHLGWLALCTTGCTCVCFCTHPVLLAGLTQQLCHNK